MSTQKPSIEEQDQVKFAKAMKVMFDKFLLRAELIAYESKVARARFLTLRREGFSVEEALKLCTKQVEI